MTTNDQGIYLYRTLAPNQEGICRCAHRQLVHQDTLQIGHGWCLMRCSCRKFRWVAFRDDITGFPLKEGAA
mgnify:CR=1 FL=1